MFQAVETPGSFAVSPLSVQLLLTLAWMGSAGDTARELSNALRFTSNPKDVVKDFQNTLEVYRQVLLYSSEHFGSNIRTIISKLEFPSSSYKKNKYNVSLGLYAYGTYLCGEALR